MTTKVRVTEHLYLVILLKNNLMNNRANDEWINQPIRRNEIRQHPAVAEGRVRARVGIYLFLINTNVSHHSSKTDVIYWLTWHQAFKLWRSGKRRFSEMFEISLIFLTGCPINLAKFQKGHSKTILNWSFQLK